MKDKPQNAISQDDMLAEFNDDALATMADDFNKEADRLFRLARGAHAELQARMRDRHAKVLVTEHWTGKMRPGKLFHTVDDSDRFRQRLVPHVSADDIAAAFVRPPAPPMRADHRYINELDKRGGLISQIIGEERHTTRGEDTLELERKPEEA